VASAHNLAVPKLMMTLALAAILASPAAAAGPVSVERQNTFVRTHCTVCHNDRANNGGLTLEAFDAARVAPSLAAMMLSKITSGTALATVNAAAHDASALAALEKGMKTGAINASGNGVPDKATVDGLVAAFAAQSAGADQWSLERGDTVTASIVRELPSAAASGRKGAEAAMYRLVLTCNAATRTGAMQLAWSPEAKRGTLAVSLDGQPATTYTVEGTERMGNGTSAVTGPAAFVFARFGGSADARIALPRRTLEASQLFAGETATFPFDQLTPSAREALSACFR
jgi:hypothetical protein